MRPSLALAVLLVVPWAAWGPAPGEVPEEAVAGATIPVPVEFSGGDRDGVEAPRDRCPDRGREGAVDEFGCPLDPAARYGDLDDDGLMNGRSIVVRADSPLVDTLRKQGIVRGIRQDGRWVFFGEASFGTDPQDPNSDRFDLLGDGLEVALRYGLTPAARFNDYGSYVVESEGAPRADPLVPDEYLEVHPLIVGTTRYWNDALDAALRQVVLDDLRPEGNATYAPPAVRLHAFVESDLPMPTTTLTFEAVTGKEQQVTQHLVAARRNFATYVLVAPNVTWSGEEVAGLAFGNYVLVAVDHKGFDACEAEGGKPGTPACDRLTDLFRWTLNHERFHRFGLPDTVGGEDLMSTHPDVRTPRPYESAARFRWLEGHQERVVHDLDGDVDVDYSPAASH